MKILVIDDEPLIRRSLHRAGEMRGHNMREATDGLEGLKMWKEWQPDLVFLDVLMPGLTGPEVLREVKTSQNGSKVILMSAYAGEFDTSALTSANLFISKPFDDIFLVIEQGESLVGC